MVLNEENFIKNFMEQLEGYTGPCITMDTVFREIDVWDSLTGAAVQIMIEDVFSSKIPDDQFRAASYIKQLYLLTIQYKE